MGGGGDCLLVDEMGDKSVDLRDAHFSGVALVMVDAERVLTDPADIGLFGAEGDSRGFTIPLGFPKAGSFSMQFWCSQAIVFWWMEVYTRCQVSHIKVLKRSNFV